MGFVNEKPDNIPASTCRVIIALFLALMILLVVLLTCLLILQQRSPSPAAPSQAPPSPISPSQTSSMAMPMQSTKQPMRSTPPMRSTMNPMQSTMPPMPPNPCPSKAPGLVPFPNLPDGSPISLDRGINYILDRNVTVNSIRITDRASLTVVDNGTAILLKTKNILIENQGSLMIGSENCPHTSPLEILLYGLSNDSDSNPIFGLKYIGVAATGSIEIHGPWKLAWTFLQTTIQPNTSNLILTLADSHKNTWKPGDRIVIASSDYDMNHAEEFSLLQCNICTEYQIQINGSAKYRHLGVIGSSGVDMRAEVGILTRNIKIHGEMQPSCYGDNKTLCQFFNYDTFGGNTKILRGARVARFEGIELYNMGQQAIGHYPIHFHRVFDAYGNYARQLSIHHCYARCVQIHAAVGLLVEDVVGYDTLGHCFFFSDGNELNITLNHNLALVTKPSTLLPSDRNDAMCITLTANISRYVPDPSKECNGVSGFWISHPMNFITNNSAAGSVDYGFFYAFYRIPTGPSAGMLPPFHGERSPLGSFVGNRAHSNGKFGFFMDRGVKTDNPSAADPRDFLALIDLERYQPHVDRNLSLPRAPAHLVNFTAYMNPTAMFVRGGDIWIENAMLSDNDVGVIMSSSPSLPYDQGSHQELVNSVVVGASPYNASWSNRTGPCVGVEIRDGPILIDDNTFIGFPADPNRLSYAIGFYPNNSGQSSPANTISDNYFIGVDTELFFGQVGGLSGSYFGNYSMDGDLTQIVNLVETNGYLPTGYAVRLDNPLLINEYLCQPNGTFLVCNNLDFGQLFVNVSSKSVRFSIRDTTLQSGQLILSGVDLYDNQHPTTTQFQPVLIANHTYRINWVNGTAPSSLNISLSNFVQNSVVDLQICYPPSTSFLSASLFLLNQATNSVTQTASVPMATNYTAMEQNFQEAQYIWSPSQSILFVRLQVTWQSLNYSYCAPDGCHFFNIVANVTYNGTYACM